MTFSWDRAWADVVAMARAHTEILLVLAGVFILLPAFAIGLYVKPAAVVSFDMEGVRALNDYFARNWLVLLSSSVATRFGEAAILVLMLDPRRPTVSQGLSTALALLFAYVVLNLITSFAVVAGLIALIVPGIYLFGRLAVAGPAMIAERETNPLNAIARSLALTRGRGWRIAGLLIFVLVVSTIVTGALKAGISVVFALLMPENARVAVSALLSAVLGTAIAVVTVLFVAAIYRQLVGEQARHAEIFS